MIDDEFDDIFSMMDRILGRSLRSDLSGGIGDNKYERLMDDDYIYYTFELREMEKDDIFIESKKEELRVTLSKGSFEREHDIKLPFPIIPKETKVTFKNGILDIIVKIDKKASNRIQIED